MTRVKRRNVSRNRHKKVLKMTQGFRGSNLLYLELQNNRI